MRKGVHPLVAATFLIAIGVGTAMLFGEWVTTFAEDQTVVVENQTDRAQACTNIRISVLDVARDGDTVHLTLLNSGFNDVDDVNVVLTGGGQVVGNQTVGPLATSEIESLVFDNAPDASTAVVIPTACPMQRDETAIPAQ